MTQAQLNRAVSKVTGEDFHVIQRRGFSPVDETSPIREDDFQALMIDWEQLQAEQATALFPDRQKCQGR